MKKTIIVDVDNTLVDQVPRKTQALKTIGIDNVSEEVIKQDFSLRSVLRGSDREAFYRIILGPDLQDHLVAFPGAVRFLNELKQDYRILYITARPGVQRDLTVDLLERLGFPKPGEEGVDLALWPLESDIAELSEEDVEAKSVEWKQAFASERASSEQVVAAISDTSGDVSAFAKLGIPSILFHSHGKPKDLRAEIEQSIGSRFLSDSIQLTTDWQVVAHLVRSLDRSEEELVDLVKTHSTEYASFLGDLDAKARLLLVLATFLGTSFFAVLWYVVSQLNLPLDTTSTILYWGLGVAGALGLTASLLAMAFCMRAFGSRHTRGLAIGGFITLGGLPHFFRNFIPVILGKKPCPPGSPVEEAQLPRKGQEALLRRLIHLAFFQRHYGTYDPAIVRNQRMLDLRALNYTKIYPEIYARTMLFAAILLVAVCAAIIIALML